MEILASLVVAPVFVFQGGGRDISQLKEGFLEVEVTQVFEQLYHIISFYFLAFLCPQSSTFQKIFTFFLHLLFPVTLSSFSRSSTLIRTETSITTGLIDMKFRHLWFPEDELLTFPVAPAVQVFQLSTCHFEQ